MYHSCSVEYRDSQRWALSEGQTGTEGHKSLETGNHSLEPSWGIALGTKAKARRVVGSGMARNGSLERLPGLFLWQDRASKVTLEGPNDAELIH